MNFESGGGTERVTSVIANELVKKNFDVRIISCQHGNSCKFEIDKKHFEEKEKELPLIRHLKLSSAESFIPLSASPSHPA